MNRNALICMILTCCASAATVLTGDPPTNFVLIAVDDMACKDVSLHGNTPAKTPQIEAPGDCNPV